MLHPTETFPRKRRHLRLTTRRVSCPERARRVQCWSPVGPTPRRSLVGIRGFVAMAKGWPGSRGCPEQAARASDVKRRGGAEVRVGCSGAAATCASRRPFGRAEALPYIAWALPHEVRLPRVAQHRLGPLRRRRAGHCLLPESEMIGWRSCEDGGGRRCPVRWWRSPPMAWTGCGGARRGSRVRPSPWSRPQRSATTSVPFMSRHCASLDRLQ